MDEREILLESVKATLQENEGEVGYWGEEIKNKFEVRTTNFDVNGSKKDLLKALFEKEIGDCHLCPLGDTRIKLVFGVGNPETDVMFVGEGPGYDEDRKGEPFVGKAGQLLDKILAAINLDRTKVYIANIVKCHPMVDSSQPEKRGNDRPPQFDEIAKCIPFLKKQIEIINPKIIVSLGATAAKALLETDQGITRLRGKIVEKVFNENQPAIPVLPTFHPAALLRNPDLKRDVWEDMKLLRSLKTARHPGQAIRFGGERDPGSSLT